ncbi:MAG: glycoside hydrolase family 125 protein [Gemmatimonadetes bacterium]|nr:glycoside hydrolase family 125 protein [Gemmatimonadota bacterium]
MTSREAPASGMGWELTGNHAVAFPAISPKDGGIARVNVLHRASAGLVEWVGGEDAPLLAPRFRVDGEAVRAASLEWERLDQWIPRFHASLGDGLHVRGTLVAPAGHEPARRGAVYAFEVENRGGGAREVEVALEGVWLRTLRLVATARAFGRENLAWRAGPGLVLETGDGAGPALAIVGGGGEDGGYVARRGPLEVEGETEVRAPNGEPITLRVARRLRVAAGRRSTAAFFLGVGAERDGALATALTLRRIGPTELLRAGRLELARLTRKPAAREHVALFTRNLLFNYFFAVARAVDDDRFYPLVSRSPFAPASAVFREREALLWSLPAITLADPPLGRELLLRCFEQFAHRAGESVHYVDGGVLAPGLALDGLCAYVVALDRYVRDAKDDTILDEPVVQDVLREVDDLLFSRLHPEIYLASTDVLPSGDAADHPYVTYDNACVRAFCDALPRVWVAADGEAPARMAGGAEEVAAAVWQHCTVEAEGVSLLAWSVDLEGEAAVYDDPGGSLALLPYLGFCDVDDPLWRNTLEFLRSSRYPFWLGDQPFPGVGARRHPRHCALAALCADLLGPRLEDALALLARLPLDGGLACEAYDPRTGAAAVGRHHAALAGFLAWSLWAALEAGASGR